MAILSEKIREGRKHKHKTKNHNKLGVLLRTLIAIQSGMTNENYTNCS